MFADDSWEVVKGEYDGSPMLVRINSNLRPFIGKSDHTLKIGFAIPLNNPQPGTMPDPKENEIINALEDQITETLNAKVSAVLALVITMGTFKELVYYAKPDIDVASIHQELKASIKSHDVQCVATIENKWETYRQFIK
jgi:hypothetical protein